MQNTLRTGSSAIVSAVMILRSDGTRRKSRRMRKARRMRTMPVFWSGTRRGTMDMATTKASTWLHTSVMKGQNQFAKALIASSTVKTTVKSRFKLSTSSAVLVGEPSSCVSKEIYSDSKTVHPKFCEFHRFDQYYSNRISNS